MKSYVYLVLCEKGIWKFGETAQSYTTRVSQIRSEKGYWQAQAAQVIALYDVDATTRKILEDHIRVSFFNTKKVDCFGRDYFKTKTYSPMVQFYFNKVATEFCHLHDIKFEILPLWEEKTA